MRRDGELDPAVVAALSDAEERKAERKGERAGGTGKNGRRTPVRPSEERRRERQLSVTFSSPDIPERLRALARAWGWVAPDGKSPAVSRVVEVLLVGMLEEAERAAEEGSV